MDVDSRSCSTDLLWLNLDVSYNILNSFLILFPVSSTFSDDP